MSDTIQVIEALKPGATPASHTKKSTLPVGIDARPSVPPGTPARETGSLADAMKRVGVTPEPQPVAVAAAPQKPQAPQGKGK
jgi:hypothetical protein